MSGWDLCWAILMFLLAVSYLNDCQNSTRFWQGLIQLAKAVFFAFFGCYLAGWVKLP